MEKNQEKDTVDPRILLEVLDLDSNELIESANTQPDNEKNKHSEFVKKCLIPSGYKKNIKAVYLSIRELTEPDDQNSDTISGHFSVVTPMMAYIDYKLFVDPDGAQNQWWYKEYQPYYYEFDFEISKSNADLVKIWRDLKNKHFNDGSDWFIGEIIYREEEANQTDSHSFCFEGVLNYSGSASWRRRVWIADKKLNNTDKKDKALQIIKGIYDDIQDSGAVDLNSFFANIWNLDDNTIHDYKIEVYNVGQANCIYVRDLSTKIAFFVDIGVPNEYSTVLPYDESNEDMKKNSQVRKNIKKLHSLQCDFIILTHWHVDHMKGYLSLSKHGENVTWIAPIITNYVYVSIARLVKRLLAKQKLIMIDNSYKPKALFSKNGFELWKGYEKQETKLNENSLIVKLPNALLPGDSMYRYWPDNLINDLQNNGCNFLVAPHHGAEIVQADKGVIKKCFSNNKADEVVFCYGNTSNSRINHPRDVHVDELRQVFQSCRGTAGLKDPAKSKLDANNPCPVEKIEYQ